MEFEIEKNMTYEEANRQGVNTSMIAVCRKLRKLAKLDRLRLDESIHRNGRNQHLFDYIHFCGEDVLSFVKNYLSNLQPYMLERRKDQEPEKSFLCVVDKMYLISVYIKVDNTQHEEVIVSFHEDHKNGIAKLNSVLVDDVDAIVPVFADCILSHISGENQYGIKVMVQRGMKILPLELYGEACADVFLVRKRDIDLAFLAYCNRYLRDLYTSNLELDFSKVSIFSTLQQISFTSYGKDLLSSISLLIDSLYIQPDRISRGAADFALTTYIQSLKITEAQKNEMLEILSEKFTVTGYKGIDAVLNRVQDSLEYAVVNPEKWKELGEGEL